MKNVQTGDAHLRHAQVQLEQEDVIDESVENVARRSGYDLWPDDTLQGQRTALS